MKLINVPQNWIAWEKNVGVVEASTLGIGPGTFPNMFYVVINGQPRSFYRGSSRMIDGELAGVTYTGTDHSIFVLND